MRGHCLITVVFLLVLAAPAGRSAQSGAPADAVSNEMEPESRGDLLMLHGRYVEAIEAYGQAPGGAVIWNKLGLAWQRLFAIGKARKYFRAALLERPDYPEAMNNLAVSYFQEQEYGPAKRYLRRALALSPESDVFLFNLGVVYFADGKEKEGAASFERAFAVAPGIFDDNPLPRLRGLLAHSRESRMHYCLAQIYARAQLPVPALQHLQEAVERGFSDRKRLRRDEAFASLRTTPWFLRIGKAMEER